MYKIQLIFYFYHLRYSLEYICTFLHEIIGFSEILFSSHFFYFVNSFAENS